MSQVPEQLTNSVWILSNILLPLSVGMVIGLSVRCIIRWLSSLCIIGLVLFVILSLIGLINGQHLRNLKSILPFLWQVTLAVKEITLITK